MLKHKPRSLNTCFIGQLIKLRTESISDVMLVCVSTGLPSYQVLVATFNHVAPHVSRRAQALDPFQEFVLVLIKLRLNVPFKDLANRFLGIGTNCFMDFFSRMNVMDYRLRRLVHWPERENLCKTKPMCFKYAFGNKVTVINLLARADI